ncbi:ATP-binding protein [Candidatus Poribacteria bacterium]|nr:ATP-binding protein [Candidatus Poribacteria bacterium]
MVNKEIIEILEDWNFWKKQLTTGIQRKEYIERLKKLSETKQIVVITGARRSGKSFIMKELVIEVINLGKNKNDILMVNFEDPRFTNLEVKFLQQIYETYLEYLDPKGLPYIFLDEIQEIEGWEKWVRTFQELQKGKVCISGSNAKLLSKELGTLLTGRHLDVEVFPLSFKEFLSFKKIFIKDDLDIVNQRIKLKSLFNEYLEFGAFPEVVLSEQKKDILLHYFDDILNKDLVNRFKIRKPEKLKALTKYYLSNISNLITFNSMEKFLEISMDTIEKFSGYLEDAYLVFFVKRFSFKIKEQEKSPRKVYCIDTGLSNTVGFRFSENSGRLLENIVFLELKRKQSKNSKIEIYYWKDIQHREVDFVLKDGLKVTQLIQVCCQLDNFKIRERETRSLIKAMDEFSIKEGLIISEDKEEELFIEGKKIKIVPLWKWLL